MACWLRLETKELERLQKNHLKAWLGFDAALFTRGRGLPSERVELIVVMQASKQTPGMPRHGFVLRQTTKARAVQD